MKEQQYLGIYEYAKSDSFIKDNNNRFHKDSPITQTILASGNQNGVVLYGGSERERERE